MACRVGSFDLRRATEAAVLGLGMPVPGLSSLRQFGRFDGGDAPERR